MTGCAGFLFFPYVYPMRLLLIIGTGSFIGGISRYLLGHLVQSRVGEGFPVGTLVINLLGCFVIGCMFGLSERSTISLELRLFVMTGLCGGFTTFSAFGLETVNLLRLGQTTYALSYVAASVLLGLLATFVGVIIFK